MQAFGTHATRTIMSRSFLFVPADSERKLDKARDGNADALIIDLEDSVAASARPAARKSAVAFISGDAPMPLWVRINPLGTPEALLDLEAVMAVAPDGIVLPKCGGSADILSLGKLLHTLEVENGVPVGRTQIMPLVTERPAALFHMGEYATCPERLAGLTWGAEDLSAALGATANRAADGSWLAPYELARSLCLLAASAAGVAAVDTVFTSFKDDDGLARYAAAARRDGFSGMLAIHPAQVGIINDAFTPSAEERARAERIVALFETNPDAGALALDGEMLDRPHLVQARRILEHSGKP
ncbi:MAG: CoA ester lyase [Woeseiaceae bacterium]|nr:CoA ester lyase [Woeseiaceae bacterium]